MRAGAQVALLLACKRRGIPVLSVAGAGKQPNTTIPSTHLLHPHMLADLPVIYLLAIVSLAL